MQTKPRKLFEQWALAAGQEPRQYLLGFLHQYRWKATKVAAKLGVATATVYQLMTLYGIPTIEQFMSFEYDGVLGSIEGHARRFGVGPTCARRKWRAGCPIEECLRLKTGLSEEYLEYVRKLYTERHYPVSKIAIRTGLDFETVRHITGAPLTRYERTVRRVMDTEKLLDDNPHLTPKQALKYLPKAA